jgi:GrpB-like predicted nucleotidyltransferase (UPF0157 family)
MKVHVVPYDPNWPAEFNAEAVRLRSALGDIAVALHHIGSTSIPGLSAKPIIDILMEVDDLQRLEARSSELAALGYEPKGEFGIPGRRYFRKECPTGVRTHHIHAFESGSPQIARHIAFREYMMAHPLIAQSYSLLKQQLAAAHPEDIEAYMDGKDLFIKEHEAKALTWQSRAQQGGCTECRKDAATAIRTRSPRRR